ncbi:MAG TPA: DUF692 family protein [Planctomycetota bacterium]|nr:DUF692 family protein [Planctomycetota bacterium]
MTARPLVGIALQPGERFWRHNRALAEERAELFEVTPETLWRAGCEPGPGHAELLAFVRRCGRPVVGHGVLASIGAAERPARRDAWLAALQRERAAFGFEWFSEHLGFADAGGLHVAWPLPLPPGDEAVAIVARSLRELQQVHPIVAFENNADLFCLGDPLAQPAFFAAICAAAGAHLLLDLHNAYAFCRNLGVELDAWLARVPWDRVLEIHLSGGSESDPDFLPSRRSLRLDSHDGAVPEPVWVAFERALATAGNLRAVVLEWLPDAMDEAAAARFAVDVARARACVGR